MSAIHSDASEESKRGSFGYSDWTLIKFMFSYITQYRREIGIILGLMMLYSFATAIGPIILMINIDRFALGDSTNVFGITFLDNAFFDLVEQINSLFPNASGFWTEVILLGIVYLLLELVVFYASYKRIMMVSELGLKAELQLRLDLYEHLQELDMSYHDKNEVGRIMSRLTSDLLDIREMVGGQVTNNIANLITVIVVLFIVLAIDPILTLVPIGLMPVIILLGILSRKYTRPRRKETRRTNSILMANIGEAIAGMEVTKGASRENRNIELFGELNRDNQAANINADSMNAIFFPLMLTMSTLGVSILIFVGGLRFIADAITVGELVAFFNYNAILFRPVVLLGQFYQQLQDALTGAERTYALLKTNTRVPYNTHLPDLPLIKGDVLFDRIHFEYISGDPIYEKFSLFVPAGKTIALVGKTGAGKSTIINILSRMYEYQKGKLQIDNTDIENINLHSYRNQIAAVPQDFFLFSSSVRENLKLGNQLATDEEMWNVLDLVGLKGYIESMPNGLDTNLSERGGKLSVGMRQLLVFAAVLVANPRILILDEATSSIDVFSEIKIQEAIKVLMDNRTSFIIAHRLSTIRNADTIVVIDHGHIVEQGTHEQLLKLKGHYYDLVKNQVELADVDSDLITMD